MCLDLAKICSSEIVARYLAFGEEGLKIRSCHGEEVYRRDIGVSGDCEATRAVSGWQYPQGKGGIGHGRTIPEVGAKKASTS